MARIPTDLTRRPTPAPTGGTRVSPGYGQAAAAASTATAQAIGTGVAGLAGAAVDIAKAMDDRAYHADKLGVETKKIELLRQFDTQLTTAQSENSVKRTLESHRDALDSYIEGTDAEGSRNVGHPLARRDAKESLTGFRDHLERRAGSKRIEISKARMASKAGLLTEELRVGAAFDFGSAQPARYVQDNVAILQGAGFHLQANGVLPTNEQRAEWVEKQRHALELAVVHAGMGGLDEPGLSMAEVEARARQVRGAINNRNDFANLTTKERESLSNSVDSVTAGVKRQRTKTKKDALDAGKASITAYIMESRRVGGVSISQQFTAIDQAERAGHLEADEAEKLRMQATDADKDQESEYVQSQLNTIEAALVAGKLSPDEARRHALMLTDRATDKDSARILSIVRKTVDTESAPIRVAAEYIAELQKQGYFGDRIIDKKGRDTTDRTRREDMRKVLQKSDPEDRARAREKLLAEHIEMDRLYNNAWKVARKFIALHPDATPDMVKEAVNNTLRETLDTEPLSRAMQGMP